MGMRRRVQRVPSPPRCGVVAVWAHTKSWSQEERNTAQASLKSGGGPATVNKFYDTQPKNSIALIPTMCTFTSLGPSELPSSPRAPLRNSRGVCAVFRKTQARGFRKNAEGLFFRGARSQASVAKTSAVQALPCEPVKNSSEASPTWSAPKCPHAAVKNSPKASPTSAAPKGNPRSRRS